MLFWRALFICPFFLLEQEWYMAVFICFWLSCYIVSQQSVINFVHWLPAVTTVIYFLHWLPVGTIVIYFNTYAFLTSLSYQCHCFLACLHLATKRTITASREGAVLPRLLQIVLHHPCGRNMLFMRGGVWEYSGFSTEVSSGSVTVTLRINCWQW